MSCQLWLSTDNMFVSTSRRILLEAFLTFYCLNIHMADGEPPRFTATVELCFNHMANGWPFRN